MDLKAIVFNSRRHRRVQEAFQRYVEWREHSSTCDVAYRAWVGAATPRDSAMAFATYTSALACEEQAAARYETAVRAHSREENAWAAPTTTS